MQHSFSQRAPSAQWEPLPILRLPGLSLWVWFRPPQLPSGVMVTIPPEIYSAYPAGLPVTLADIIQSAGIAVEQLHSVSLYGGEWQPGIAMGPFLGHPVPAMMPGARPEIMIAAHEPAAPAAGATGPAFAPPVTDDAFEFPADDGAAGDGRNKYERVEAAWRSAIQMERQMTGLRQKLSSVLTTMGKYDRELHPQERLAADREDRDAWHDARRWLRDLSAKCHREIKSFDIGMTSAAGKRTWMEETFENVIKPRVPSGDLENIRHEFEVYRKDMVNLQKSMQAALQAATQNGTQRAQRVLGVISRKIKERRAKQREPLGGTNMDRSVRRKT